MLNTLNTFFGVPLVSVLSGAAITWVFAWLYYKKAGDELRDEASRLHRTTEMILRWLEANGENVSVVRNPEGVPTGLAHDVTLSESGNATSTEEAQVVRAPRKSDR